jgi:hypothetical protein
LSRFFMRDTRTGGTYGSALAACCWLAAATAPATCLLSAGFDLDVSPAVGFSACATVLALFVAVTATPSSARAVFAAYLSGPTAICALLTPAWRGLDSQAGATIILAFAAVLAFWMSNRPASQPAESREEH